jgi:hypothetical protein
VVGGDFNTNGEEFTDDTSLETLIKAGFASCMQNLAPTMRVTHPGGHGYPDTTFDYIFARNAEVSAPEIIRTKASDHLPVTCMITIPESGKLAATNSVAAFVSNAETNKQALGTTASTASTPQPAEQSQLGFVVVTRPITIKVPYGTTVIQPGTRLPVVARNPQTVNVKYMDAVYPLPASATN